MDSKVDISNETLRHLIRQTDSRLIPARVRRADAELIARRLRRMQTGRLRARISQG
jgi:hypothetical protein